MEQMTHNTAACNSRLASIGDALYAIGGKWKLRIIMALSEGSLRFNELQRMLEGISARVLSNELKELELNGFVKRTVHIGTQVVVAYERTEYAHTLYDVLRTLSEWGTMHRKKIMEESRAGADVVKDLQHT